MTSLRLLATALVAWFCFASADAVSPLTDSNMAAYTYDAAGGMSPPIRAATERGPPTGGDQDDIDNAADRVSRGAEARADGPTPRAAIIYNDAVWLVQVAQPMGTTHEQARRSDGEVSSIARSGVAAKSEGPLSRLLGNRVRDERGSIGPFGKGTTEAGNRGARYSGKWYDSEDAARRAAERYAAKHPSSCTFRGLCGAGDHYHVDKEINGFLMHTRHYYFPR